MQYLDTGKKNKEIKMRKIYQVLILIFITISFSACFSVNLKNELPSITYYKLDTTKAESKICEAYNLIGLIDVEIPNEYKNNRILYIDNNKVNELKGVHFIGDIGSDLENMIAKEFNKHCLKIINPPFSGIKIESYLKIKLLDFQISKDNMEASINFSYQITSQGQIWQSGIISQTKPLKSFSEEDIIKTMQDISISAIEELANKLIPKY